MILPTIESRPTVALRTTAFLVAALGLIAVSVVASLTRSVLELSPAYSLKAALLFGAIATVVLVLVEPHHPYRQFGAANVVTLSRAMLVALLAAAIGEPASRTTAWVAAVLAGVIPALDGADGWLARRAQLQSPFGARFDMEVDALHVLVMSGLLWQFGKAGVWVWLGGLLRYAFVAAGWLLPFLAQPLRPTRRGRVVTAVHMTTVSIALAPFIPVSLSAVALAVTTTALCWSFAIDIGRLWRGEGAL